MQEVEHSYCLIYLLWGRFIRITRVSQAMTNYQTNIGGNCAISSLISAPISERQPVYWERLLSYQFWHSTVVFEAYNQLTLSSYRMDPLRSRVVCEFVHSENLSYFKSVFRLKFEEHSPARSITAQFTRNISLMALASDLLPIRLHFRWKLTLDILLHKKFRIYLNLTIYVFRQNM